MYTDVEEGKQSKKGEYSPFLLYIKMDKKKRIGLTIIFICIVCMVIYFVMPSKNKYLIYEGSAQKVHENKRKENDIFYIGVSQTTDGIHPYKQDNETMDILLDLVYEPLAYFKEDTSIKYINAENITFEKEGKEAKVKINTDKVFSDKTALTVDLVMESYQWFREQDTVHSKLLANIKDIKKIDNQNLLFIFEQADFENIKVFTLPIIYQQDKQSYYGTTFLGTGAYKIVQLKNQEDIILERNTESKRHEKYEKIILKYIDYNEINSIIKNQKIDMFVINKDEHFDKIKESGAYDVYELENKQKGFYLVYNIKEEKTRSAIAKVVEGQEFFDITQEKGVYSSGIVSAYKDGDNYYSLIKSGSLEGLKSLKIRHDYDGTSLSIFQNIAKKLNQKGIKCQEVKVALDGYQSFKEDLYIYQGNYNRVLTADNIKEFYKMNSELPLDQFYNQLEEYLANKNIMSPLSKETRWIACLTTKDTLDFFE